MSYVIVETNRAVCRCEHATIDILDPGVLTVSDTATEDELMVCQRGTWQSATVFDERDHVLFSFSMPPIHVRLVILDEGRKAS